MRKVVNATLLVASGSGQARIAENQASQSHVAGNSSLSRFSNAESTDAERCGRDGKAALSSIFSAATYSIMAQKTERTGQVPSGSWSQSDMTGACAVVWLAARFFRAREL